MYCSSKILTQILKTKKQCQQHSYVNTTSKSMRVTILDSKESTCADNTKLWLQKIAEVVIKLMFEK